MKTKISEQESIAGELEDLSTMIHTILRQASACFTSIEKLPANYHGSSVTLAGLGHYLCDDWANNFDLEIESLVNRLRGKSDDR